MKIYHNVSIDLTLDDACVNIPALKGTEGDCGTHVLKIRLLQDGKLWPVPADVSAVISYARHDGTGAAYDTLPDGQPAWYVEDGLLYVLPAPACFSLPTQPWEEIWLTVTLLQAQKQLTTRRIPIMVRRALVASGEDISAATGSLSAHGGGQNLLHNWYFPDVINQRLMDFYAGPGVCYDRWFLGENTAAEAVAGGMTISCGAKRGYMGQYVDGGNRLNGMTVTFSALLTANAGNFVITLLRDRGGALTYLGDAVTDGTGIVTGTCTIPENFLNETDKLLLKIGCGDTAGKSYTVTAVKLEPGDRQTLARQLGGKWQLCQIPDRGQTLYACQQFFQCFRSQSLRPTRAADFRPPLRGEPVLSFLSVDGVSYYTAEAEL